MQITVRLTNEDEERFARVARETGIKPYQLARRLIMLGVDRFEAGCDIFKPGSEPVLMGLVKDLGGRIDDECQFIRARELNLALELFEIRTWLRTFADVLPGESRERVKENVRKRVIESRATTLEKVESLPHDAPEY